MRNTRWILGAMVLLIIARPSLYAVDGVILIDQNRALVGNVTPGDAPGFPVTISQPGSYRLSGNLTVSSPDLAAIEVRSNDVTIDLNGFAIIGPGIPGTGVGYGIVGSYPDVDFINIAVRNGTVRGMGGTGVLLSSGSIVENVRAIGNGFDGISVGGRSLIIGNMARSNRSYGIIVGDRSTVRNNVAASNGRDMSVTCPSSIVGNTALGSIETFSGQCTRDQNSPAP